LNKSPATKKPRVVAIVGPTGSGKSALGWHLAREFGGELVSADSVQVYRGLDIGSAKATAEERRAVIHHLVDILDPDEEYSAARFRNQAAPIIQSLQERNIPVFVVGGTGLYLRTLTRGIFRGPEANPELRRSLGKQAEEKGSATLHEELKRVDRDAASRIHPRDAVRIIRALEVYQVSGQPISGFQKEHGFKERDFNVLKIGISFPRDELFRRIEARVHRMLERGWVEEVRGLLRQGYSPRLKSLQSLGYRQVISFLQGEKNIAETVRSIQGDTRRYAKRQLTWFKADPEIHWFPGEREDIGPIRQLVAEFWGRKADE
jgi:tRNA dimethylallyltransferase